MVILDARAFEQLDWSMLDQCYLVVLVVVDAVLANQSAAIWHSVLVSTESIQPTLLVLDVPLLSVASTNLRGSNVAGIFHACLLGLACALCSTNVCICVHDFCAWIQVGLHAKSIRSTTCSLLNSDPCMLSEESLVVAVVVGSLAELHLSGDWSGDECWSSLSFLPMFEWFGNVLGTSSER
jgi:hypothetical protein